MEGAITLTSVLENVGTFLTAALGWIGDVAEYVASNPLLFIMVFGISLAGIAISYLARLIRL